ncbi:MAG: response regulator [Oscillatoria sp. SIO1A7]|nr:response regulator [Oscillatoria sp. SIO1A7]
MSLQNKKPKILLVDDEQDNLDLLYRTFYRDYKVRKAENAPQALDILAAEGDIAVIISDQRMPRMSGTELLSVTATRYPDTIRIILTAYTDVEDLVDAINAGKVFKYVTKPWAPKDLKEVVKQAVDTHNVLKARTEELCRSLRQESLLNAITNTIRSRNSVEEVLQTIVETLGHMFETSYCILRPFQDGKLTEKWFIYDKSENSDGRPTIALPGLDLSREEILAQTVWETTTIETINDVETDDRLQGSTPELQERSSAYRAANIRSSLVVPLIFRMELMAVLALHQCDRQRDWQDDETQLVFMVADQAALSLSQARAYEQAQSLARQQSLINTITAAIRSSLNPKDIFAAITQQLGVALQVDGCALSLWTQENEYVQCVGLYDRGESVLVDCELDSVGGCNSENQETDSQESITSPLPRSVVMISNNPVLQQLLATQKPAVIADLQETPELNVADLPLRSPARSLMVVPLVSDGNIIGSISLRQTDRPRQWQQSEIDLAVAVAAQAAIAVQQSRLYQKTREQAERLLELDRLKTEFFQNISHEFRTPLTLMMGPLETAVERQKDLPNSQAEIALRNSRRLLRLVNQLLDLQRLDASRMQPTFRPCDLAVFVEQTVEAFRPYCEKKGILVETEIDPCPRLYLDLEKFDKVLYNLLSNGMKFTKSGGKIAVSISNAGDYCLLKVSDTGIGIRTDQIPHLFDRFRQAEGSANRSYEGSGLGLALVKEMVELHRGQITVDSTYGEGTTFTVWLQTGTAHLPPDYIIEVPTGVMPNRAEVELADVELADVELANVKLADAQLAQAQLARAQGQLAQLADTLLPAEELGLAMSDLSIVSNAENNAPARLDPSQGDRTILVVDDNVDLRVYLSEILRNDGYRVLFARNGAEGLEMASNYAPNLIVTDLMMPMVSGLDLIRKIRQEPKLKGTPIILLTAKTNSETRIEGAEVGADAYLAKPFNDRELLAEVRNLLALKDNERQVIELNRYLTESVLRRFLPEAMVAKAAAGALELNLSPEPHLITILFSDIVGFTQLSNNLRSRRVAEILNEYLTEMTRAAFENSGTVDKFVGDAIMVLFGAPQECSPNEQVRRAVATARQMLRSLDRLNAKWQSIGLPRVSFRCGIHQGTAVVGMFGGEQRSDYTAVGPSINIAARLQEAADPGTILVSAAIADYLEDDGITKFKPLQLKGIDETVLTFVLSPE